MVPWGRHLKYIVLVVVRVDEFVQAVWMPDIIVGGHTTNKNTFDPISITSPAWRATSDGIIKVKGYGKLSFLLFATDSDLVVEFAVSQDGTNFYVKDDSISVAVGTGAEVTLTDPYSYVRFRVKPAASDAHGTLTLHGNGSSMG